MAKPDEPKAKWGSETVPAMGRQGLRELRGAFYPESNVAQQTELGVYGTKTPGEVAESRRDDDRSFEDEAAKPQTSILGDRLRQAEGRGVHGRDDKQLEPER